MGNVTHAIAVISLQLRHRAIAVRQAPEGFIVAGEVVAEVVEAAVAGPIVIRAILTIIPVKNAALTARLIIIPAHMALQPPAAMRRAPMLATAAVCTPNINKLLFLPQNQEPHDYTSWGLLRL